MTQGCFISFEGVDASGKTSVIKEIEKYLSDKKLAVISTREPGGKNNYIAEKIRDILLDKKNLIDPLTETLLFASSRSYHVQNLIKPKLDQNFIVLCDRYIDSSLVYQGYAKKVGIEKVWEINKFIYDIASPDITFYLKLDQETYFKRISGRKEMDRLDSESKQLFDDLLNGYEKMCEQFKNRYVVIDARKPFEEVVDNIKCVLNDRIKV